MRFVGIGLMLLFLGGRLSAQDSLLYIFDSTRQVHDLRSHTRLLANDGSNNAKNVDSILQGSASPRFVAFPGQEEKVKVDAYWLHCRIDARNPVTNWVLLLKDSHAGFGFTSQNDYVDVYYVRDGQVLTFEKTGTLVPASQKKLQRFAGFNGVPFSIQPGKPLDIYIRVRRDFYANPSFSYPVIMQPGLTLATHTDTGVLLLQLSTIAFVFFAISLFFYFFVRERSYLFFALYTLTLSQHYLILHPDLIFIDRYIPRHPEWVPAFWSLLTIGGFILFCIFGKWFMNLPRLSPITNKWLNTFLYTWSALLIANTISRIAWQYVLLPEPVFYFAMLIMMGFIVRFAFFKSPLAKLYVGGAIWLFIFTALGLLSETGVISIAFNPWPIGQVGQFLIYAAGLAYKVRLNEKSRAEANRIREMDSIKSKFFANISHEFRTPLTLIQGPLQQIEEQLPSNRQADAVALVPIRQLRTMRRNTDRLLELVNQLLDLSKLDAGNMRLEVIRGDLVQFLKSIAFSFDSMAERKQIHYRVHFPEQTPISFFDKDKLEKIFVNLLGNAFKYTPEKGTVTVTVETEENRVRMIIEDDGPGIHKKELDKIFDRFYQVEGTGDKGSGIGLALVKELVELYRGQISVTSEPGKGSRFRVSLPIEKTAFREDELVYGEWKGETVFTDKSVAEKTAMVQSHPVNTSLPLLLVVEDNPELRQFIRETVEESYQVVEAANGQEGFEKALVEIPDLIISDVMMPVMDGMALAAQLRKDEKTSHIPVILLTAKAGQQHKIEGLETGADDYLTKPFDAKELLARVNNLIQQRKRLRKKFAGAIHLKPAEVTTNSLDEKFLVHVMQAIETNMEEEEFGVEELARKVAMSRSQLHRKLTALVDKSPSDLIRQTRLLRAKELLQKKATTPSEVAFKVGFNSHTYFSKCFKEEFGVSPSEIGQR